MIKLKGKMSSIFWKGLFTVLPIYLTGYFLYWLISSIEITISKCLALFIGDYYFPGLGLLTALVGIFFIGLMLQIYIGQSISSFFSRGINRLPVIGEIYSSLQAVIKYITAADNPKGKEVVMVHFESINLKLLGIVTRKQFERAPNGIDQEEWVSVYLPMSYQIGGFTVYVPWSSTTPVDMGAKEALKWAFMGGIDQNSQ